MIGACRVLGVLSGQCLDDFSVDAWTAGHRASGIDASVARGIAEHSAGFLNHRKESGRVPYIKDGVEHEVGSTGGDEHVAIGIAPGSVCGCLFAKFVVAGLEAEFLDMAGVGGQERCLGQ